MRIFLVLTLLMSNLLSAQEAGNATNPAVGGVADCLQPNAAQVQQMIDAVGGDTTLKSFGVAFIQEMIDAFKKARPDITPEYWDHLMSTLTSEEVTRELVKRLIPIYQQHFCSQDVEQIVLFYRSRAGQKMIAEMPALEKESIQAGKSYVEEFGAQLLQQLQNEGSPKK